MANNFFSRWSQRKLEPEQATSQSTELEKAESRVEHSTSQFEADVVSAGDLELPTEASTLNSVSEESTEGSLANLLASEVESSVKKAAMRKLFLSEEFNQVDALNDYDHDFKAVKSLSSDVAERLRDWVNDHDDEEPVADSPPSQIDAEEEGENLELGNSLENSSETSNECVGGQGTEGVQEDKKQQEENLEQRPDDYKGQNIPYKK
ncbi:DUF3306 domain-containing protein [Vibrio mexicanus]|uniref:DUF3306 domain-containing protein n=1 Tax=Vibrio mexicanus TaxID=1004326 RepID=UPI00063C8B3A|nr:DUF3306 domain-containing protein [Vibrio mexicanus]